MKQCPTEGWRRGTADLASAISQQLIRVKRGEVDRSLPTGRMDSVALRYK